MKKGFTLIELLVVIAIIGVLSSVVLASLNTARVKANDAKMQGELRNLSTAIQLYYDKYGVYPPNVNTSDHNIAINLPVLVSEGFIGSLPTSPNPSYPYQYYRYGPSTYGAMLVGFAQGAAAPTAAGYPGTCRPFAPNTNWCDQAANSKYYCLCHPY